MTHLSLGPSQEASTISGNEYIYAKEDGEEGAVMGWIEYLLQPVILMYMRMAFVNVMKFFLISTYTYSVSCYSNGALLVLWMNVCSLLSETLGRLVCGTFLHFKQEKVDLNTPPPPSSPSPRIICCLSCFFLLKDIPILGLDVDTGIFDRCLPLCSRSFGFSWL